MKIIIKEAGELAGILAEKYAELLEKKPDAVLGFAAGHSQLGVFDELAKMCKDGKISFAGAKVFCVSEFIGAKGENSARGFLEKNLFSRIDIDPKNVHYPCLCAGDDEDALKKYDEEIKNAGGIDLMLLGIGTNGAIGFNEPATPFESYTHTQLLTQATRERLAADFGGIDAVPEKGVTMGIKTIMASKAAAMIALGEEKAEIIYKMVYGKTVTYVPASMFQIHLDMTLYLDGDAAKKLTE